MAGTVARERARAQPGGEIPLSSAQERLWFIDLLSPRQAGYNNFIVRRFRGRLEPDVLERAFTEIVRRHDTLRTTFATVGGTPVGRLVEPFPVELRVASAADEDEVRRLAAAEVQTPFDLAAGPLVRPTLYRLAPDDQVLLVTVHHIVADGWSLGVLYDELTELYDAFVRGLSSPLPEPLQYVEYVEWQRERLESGAQEAALDYWCGKLADAATLELPTDRPRPPLQTYTGAAHFLTLPPELGARVAEVARGERATPYMTYLAAYVALLSRYARQDDVVVGTAVAARLRPEFERMIGFFANTCAVRVDVAGDPSFRDLVGRVRKTTFEAIQHQDAPFEQIVRRLNVPRDPSRNPIFQALFGLLNTPPPLVDLPGVTQLDFELDAGTTRFDLELLLFGNDERLRAHFVYNTDLFDAGTVEQMAESLLVLLDAVVGDPALPVSQLPLLTPRERRRVLAGLKAAPAPPAAATVHELVERRAAADPDAPAVRFGATVLSYGELVARSRRLAARLPAAQPVGVCVERSPDLVVALLGVLQASGAYVALDPRYPRERLEFVLADSGAAAVVTQARLRDRLPEGAPPTILVDDAAGPAEPTPRATPETLAYVIYTSGSTGTPKGVAMPHRPLVNLVGWHLAHPRLGLPAVTLQLAAASFDVAFQEIFTTLATGGTLVLLGEDAARDPAAIWDTIVAAGVERLFATPTALELVAQRADERRAPLRDIVASGEPLRVSPAIAALVERTGAVLHNQYGPSETHVVTSSAVAAGDATPPIGQPLPNVELYVLDATLEPVPIGVPAELFIGGPVVSRGYVARPALTAERYLPDPFSGRPGARLYRTGDVVRRRADGELAFVERADTQVKVRGFRIELGEVEARLGAHPAVRAAAAAVHGDGPSKRLVAYVVGDEPALAPGALRSFLAERLPEHMLPGAYVVLPELPLTRTGKLNRAALPAPPSERVALAPAYVEPATSTERRLAAIWAEVLELDRVGAEDDFFALGGDSFRASRVAARVDTAVRALFEHPTVRALARRLDEAAAAPGDDGAAAGDELSPVERRFFFAAQVDEATPQTTGFALRLRGALDVEALRRAVAALVARHPALRSGFELDDGEPRRRVLPAATQVDVEVVEVAREDEASALADVFLRPFDLSCPPLLRARVLRLADDEHVLACAIHHVATDGWSNAILVGELAALYRDGPAATLPPAPDYGAFVAWQRDRVAGPEGERQRAYWRRRLAGLEPLALPFDRRPPAVPSFRAGRLRFALKPALLERVASLARDARATPFMVYTAALWEVLRAVTGQEDVAFATPTGGRPRPEFERVVGPFVNTLVLRSERREPTFGALLAAARQTVLDAFEHQDLPFDDVVASQEAERRPGRNPLVQVMLSLQNQPPVAPDFGGLDVEPVDVDAGASVFDLVVRCRGPEVEVVYRTDFFDEATAQALRRRFVATLEGAPATPEERRFLAACNATARSVAAEPTLHELVAAQVERTPTAPAVSYAGRTLSYADLHERATALAGALQAAGAGPERPVGVRLERSLDLPVALLAVLHAGAACVPIDPAYPAARVREMLAAVRPVAVVAEAPLDGVAVVPPDARAPFAPVAVDPSMLAFVLFTSGSTGAPKAVALPHAGLVNRIACGRERDRLGPGERVLHKASISFDVALHEIFTPLASGALLELAEPRLHADPAYLVELVRRRGLTCIHFVPSLLQHVVAEPGLDECRSLRRVLCGGEELPPDLAARLLQRLPHVDLHNQYGPTEASISVAFHRVGLGDLERPRVPVGTPIANTQLHVVDERLAPLPVAVVGELCIGGIAVARGYLGDPAATADRFVPDPFGPPGARLYRTGDRARRLPDGAVEVLGRLDDQVKVRGNRVELAEVEAALRACPGVAEAAAAVDGDELVATVAGAASADGLTGALREVLPAFMVPTRIALVESVPRMPSGKVDREAVRRLARAQRPARPAPAAYGVAAELLEIWRRVLGRDDVGPDDPFFSVGGHSLLVLRVVAAARERGLPLTARLMLEHQTVAAVAAALDAPPSAGRFVRLNDRPGPPIVLFHPGGGGVGCYRPLAERSARLVLGVEAPPELPGTLSELAAAYAAELHASLPEPHTLGGWSFGAAVAFETARALADAGHEVARLVLVEPPLLDGTVRDSTLEPLRALRERGLARGDGVDYCAALVAAGLGDPGEAWAAFPLDTWIALETAAHGHRFGRYDGAVDLVVSDACVDRDHGYYATHAFGASFADYRDRWRALARDVVVHQFAGDHFSLVDADVAGLAAVVERL
jgi:amino acid adenylation domain-containing protein